MPSGLPPKVGRGRRRVLKEERTASAIDQLADALGLESKPTVDDIWTDEYLPPAAERMIGR